MADLRQWLHDARLGDVHTYIQSGNIVIDHPAKLDVASLVRDAITTGSGLDVPVLVRSAKELTDLVACNPYDDDGPRVHVSFLDTAPDRALLEGASEQDWSPEEYTVLGRDVYLHLPHGMGKSFMVPRLKFLKDATTRNWNTVLALVEMSTR